MTPLRLLCGPRGFFLAVATASPAVLASSVLGAPLTAPSSPDGSSTGLVLVQTHFGALDRSGFPDADQGHVEKTAENISLPEFCLGDLCVPNAVMPSMLVASVPTEPVDDDPPVDVQPACKAEMKPRQRLFLMQLARMFSGTTALEGVLMSSPKLATLCSYGGWQCEGSRIMDDQDNGLRATSWDIGEMLRVYSQHWDLDRPVLFDKSPKQMLEAKYVREGLLQAKLPRRMQKHGIQNLKRAYILLWRPVCLAHLSHNGRSEMEKLGQEDFARKELKYYQLFIANHRYLMDQGEPILVVSVAELIWHPRRSQKRLEQFLPCAGKLDVNYVPRLGKDVFEGNDWKAKGSVVDFGKHVDSTNFYDLETGMCRGEEDAFQFLPPAERREATQAVNYLLKYSGIKR